MKFSDYTADLKEANIEGDPKLYKKIEEIRKKLKEFKGSKEDRFVLGGDLAKAMSDYLESTLKRGKVNEAIEIGEAATKCYDALIKAQRELTKVGRYAFVVYKEVYGNESAGNGALFETLFSIQGGRNDIKNVLDDIYEYAE